MFRLSDAIPRGSSPHILHVPQPVRRHSYREGHCEVPFWSPTPRERVDFIIKGSELLELESLRERRQTVPRARNGVLGREALRVLRALGERLDYVTGRLEVSYSELMDDLGLSRGAVAKALDRLRRAGMLDWLRRFTDTLVEDGFGPRVRQVPNAYRFCLPPAVERLLAMPEDFAERRRIRAREVRKAAWEERCQVWAARRAAKEAQRARLAAAREAGARKRIEATPSSPVSRGANREAEQARRDAQHAAIYARMGWDTGPTVVEDDRESSS